MGASPIGANLSDQLLGTEGEGGEGGETGEGYKKGETGEASSPLHYGMVPDDPPTGSGELASPVCSARTEAACLLLKTIFVEVTNRAITHPLIDMIGNGIRQICRQATDRPTTIKQVLAQSSYTVTCVTPAP